MRTTGIAQSFLESINASIAPKHEPTVTLNGSSPVDAPVCECCCRCGRGAKAGRPATKKSKSYTNLRTGISELSGWEIEPPVRHEGRPVEKKEHSPGESPLEKLPKEVLGEYHVVATVNRELIMLPDDIIADLALDLPPTDYKPRNVDLISCLLTSKTLHVATISTLYRQITIPHSTIFTKFLLNVNEHPGLGTLVRRLDLSHFTSVGFGRSRQLNAEIQNLTATTLARCIELTPWVQEILLQENLDDDIDVHVLQKIFFGLPKLRAVDFCAASSQPFVQSFTTMMQSFRDSPSTMFGIRRLSLHECFTLPSSAFETLLPRLTQLTHLDVSHTRITNTALKTLPTSARLTHLNLGRCIRISGEGVVDFLTAHPAASTLIYLNLACDISRYRMLWEPDVDRLLPALPTSLRSLNLNGAHIHPHHLRYLLPLTKHLEELGLANADLSLDDINSIFRPPSSRPRSLSPDSMDTDDIWIQPALHYLDLTNIPAITQATLFNTPAPRNLLLTPASLPLEVIELGDKAISSLRECRNTNKRLGWCVKELGRRGWYVREPLHSNINPGNGGSSSVPNSPALHAARTESWVEAVSAAPSNGEAYQRGGKRGWKMGAMWWGMRKCPVAWGEVGGLYGHYMFKK